MTNRNIEGFEWLNELRIVSSSSAIIGEKEILQFDCGHLELNEALRTNYNRYDSESGRTFIIVNKEFQILGFICCSLFSLSLVPQAKQIGVSIDYLGIHKDFQKRGLGSLLVVAVLRLAFTIECWLPIAGVRVFALEEAVEFYEQLGFIDSRYNPIDNGDPVEMYFPNNILKNGRFKPFMKLFSIALGNE